jgi:hypothetical protein
MTFSGRLLGPACADAEPEDAAAPENRDESAGIVIADDTDGLVL